MSIMECGVSINYSSSVQLFDAYHDEGAVDVVLADVFGFALGFSFESEGLGADVVGATTSGPVSVFPSLSGVVDPSSSSSSSSFIISRAE